MKNKKTIENTPMMIKGTSFFDMIKEAAEKARKSEENFKNTGLCQSNIEVSPDVWEPCKRQADPKTPRHLCSECQAWFEKTLKELHDSQGPGDFLMQL